ncbi:MAG: DUF1294 domain-containing protein [Oscillospiraceae bacterium]|jgi:uncharacterized membrane protein YsdA (DUF1294 family)
MNLWFISLSHPFLLVLAVYLLIVNLIGFVQMGIDKRRSIQRRWRIPEAQLFLVAAIGGSVGSLLGMYVFRHKTKHKTFVIGMPLILIVQLILAGCIYHVFL